MKQVLTLLILLLLVAPVIFAESSQDSANTQAISISAAENTTDDSGANESDNQESEATENNSEADEATNDSPPEDEAAWDSFEADFFGLEVEELQEMEESNSAQEETTGEEGTDGNAFPDTFVTHENRLHLSLGLDLTPQFDFSDFTSDTSTTPFKHERSFQPSLLIDPSVLFDFRLNDRVDWESNLSASYKGLRLWKHELEGSYVTEDYEYVLTRNTWMFDGDTSLRFYPTYFMRLKPSVSFNYTNMYREDKAEEDTRPRNTILNTDTYALLQDAPSELEDGFTFTGKLESVFITYRALMNILLDYQIGLMNYLERNPCDEFGFLLPGNENRFDQTHTVSLGMFMDTPLNRTIFRYGIKTGLTIRGSNSVDKKARGFLVQAIAEFSPHLDEKIKFLGSYSLDFKSFFMRENSKKQMHTFGLAIDLAPLSQLTFSLSGGYTLLKGSNLAIIDDKSHELKMKRFFGMLTVTLTFDALERKDRGILLPEKLAPVGSSGQSGGCSGGSCSI